MAFRLAFVCTCVLLASCSRASSAPSVTLAVGGQATLPIVVAPGAAAATKATATELAAYLKRITGARFEVTAGDGRTGVALGTAADFPALDLPDELKINVPERREDYLLRSHAQGLHLIAATARGVPHAAWDLLHRLGYRHYFPGKNWEIIPTVPHASITVDTLQSPAYLSRRIWYSYGTWKENQQEHERWETRNRMGDAIRIQTKHIYEDIIRSRQTEFKAHPEYLSGPNKLCVSQPGLRRLVVDYALDFFAKNPDADGISMDPSDGGGWNDNGGCADSTTYKSITDRVVTLANEVAAGIQARYPEKYVGIYAYNYHSPPPGIRVHPRIIVGIATAFIKGGYSVDSLISGWRKQGATIGIREYYSIIHWDKDMPMAPRAAALKSLTSSIASFHTKGARYLSAESSDNWGPAGLGYYLAARAMWDVEEARSTTALINDFLTRSFGPARAPMEQYLGQLYRDLPTSRRMPLSEDFIGRLYRHLDAAFKLSDDAGITARIGDFAYYTRFIELQRAYMMANGQQRQSAFEAMIRFAYRTHSSHMVHSLAQYRVVTRDKKVTVPPGADFKTEERKNPWKSSDPVSAAEVRAIVDAGIQRNLLFTFEPVDFSQDLVPATPLRLPPVAPGKLNMVRGGQTYFTYITDPAKAIILDASSGHTFTDRGGVRLQLFDVRSLSATVDVAAEPEGLEKDEAPPEIEKPGLLAEAKAPPDKATHELLLKSPRTGLHRVELQDNKGGSRLGWRQGTPMVFQSSASTRTAFWGNWIAYFYVPRGTKSVSGFADGRGAILDSRGQKVYEFNGSLKYFDIPVPPGGNGTLWCFNGKGQLGLMTVPPYLALRADELLLPREVVEKDKG